MSLHVHFSSDSVEWETPQELFNKLDEEFSFDVDVCATPHNAKVATYFTPDQDGLSQEWRGTCWMNPPYGRQISKWIRKAYESAKEGATVVCLIPSRTDTTYWHDFVMKGEVRFLKGRLYFKQPDGTTGRAPFPSAVVVFRGEATA